MKVILSPLCQDSHILTILSISSKVIDPIITKFHTELPSFIICSNGPGHMPNMIFFSKSSSLEPIADHLGTLYVGSSTQVQQRLFK